MQDIMNAVKQSHKYKAEFVEKYIGLTLSRSVPKNNHLCNL